MYFHLFCLFVPREESQVSEAGAAGLSDICGGFQDVLPDQSQDTNSDELLAHMLQLQFDQEYDRDLVKEEAKYNGTSKGFYSKT